MSSESINQSSGDNESFPLSSKEYQALEIYRKDFGDDIAHAMIRDLRRLENFSITVLLQSDDPCLINFVNAPRITVENIPHYHVLSHFGRSPYLFEMLNYLNEGLIKGISLIKDHHQYQHFKGLPIGGLAYDYLCWHYPTAEKIQFIKDAVGGRRVLEVGCGRGLITVLLSGVGIDIVATDSGAWSDDRSASEGPYFTYCHKLDNRAAIKKYASDPQHSSHCPVLLVCWAIADIPWKEFKGDFAIIIGNIYACEGYPDTKEWELVSSFSGKQWGVDKIDPDTINCYRRK